jgi:hypothetical protein
MRHLSLTDFQDSIKEEGRRFVRKAIEVGFVEVWVLGFVSCENHLNTLPALVECHEKTLD